MKSHYRVVVIGGGVVGTSVLYHLARLGWTDVALIERAELTAGSTWHAAAGFHVLNDDPNVAALQSYTIKLYAEIEKESGQNVGMHMPGGYSIATTPARWEWLKAECGDLRDARNRSASRHRRGDRRRLPDRRSRRDFWAGSSTLTRARSIRTARRMRSPAPPRSAVRMSSCATG